MSATMNYTPVFPTVAAKYSGFTKLQATIGAGGFVVSMDQSADGLLLAHCPDVTGALIRTYPGDTKWRWLMTPASLQASEFNPFPSGISNGDGGLGCVGTRIAPSNKNVIYTFFNSRVMKSINGAAAQPTFLRCAMGQFYMPSNSGEQRYSNRAIDIHPTNPDIAIFGTTHYATDTTKSGAFYTTDGGVTATKITGMSDATNRGTNPDRYLVAIDPGDATKGYVHVGGIGLYPLTITAGGVMTAGALIASSPLRCQHLFVEVSGDVFVCAGGNNGGVITNDLYKRTRAGVVTTYTTGLSTGAITAAVNPANALIIYVAGEDQRFGATYDGGTTWVNYNYFNSKMKRTSGELSWLSDIPGFTGVFAGQLMFDKSVANKLWIAHGTGISWCDAPTVSSAFMELHDYSKGNEEKVAHAFQSVPGNRVTILGNWDYSIWPMIDLTAWTNIPTIPANSGLAIASDFDYAIDDNSYYVVAVAQNTASNSYSPDKGLTWARLPNQSAFPYSTGAIAVGNKLNIVTIGTSNGASFYTKNGGSTWNPLQLAAGVTIVNMINDRTIRRKIVTSDKTRANVFAVVVPGITSASAPRSDAGLWVTLDGGDTWTQKISGIIGSSIPGFTGDTRQYYREKLRYIPGFSGEMLHTCHDDLGPDWLHHITNDGTSIVRLGGSVGVTDVTDFDFGPVIPGQTRPCVGFRGKVSGVEGLYISYDWFATAPTLITTTPPDNLSGINAIGMDRNRVRMFVGGIGWDYYD